MFRLAGPNCGMEKTEIRMNNTFIIIGICLCLSSLLVACIVYWRSEPNVKMDDHYATGFLPDDHSTEQQHLFCLSSSKRLVRQPGKLWDTSVLTVCSHPNPHMYCLYNNAMFIVKVVDFNSPVLKMKLFLTNFWGLNKDQKAILSIH